MNYVKSTAQVATTYKEETAPVFNDDILYQRTILHITKYWKQHWQQQQQNYYRMERVFYMN